MFSYCKLHHKRIIQLGSCLSCTSSAQICEAKGCIKYHSELESVHNVVTTEYVRSVMDEYSKTDQTKKAYIKQMVHEYFLTAK